MVSFRAGVVVVSAARVCVLLLLLPAHRCLALPTPPPSQHLHDLALPPPHRRFLAPDYAGDTPPSDHGILSRLEEAQILRELEDPSSPAAYRLQQALSQLAEEAVASGGLEGLDLLSPRDVAAAAAAAGGRDRDAGDWEDPRYFLLEEYLTRGGGADSTNSDNMSTIRKTRNSRDNSSSDKAVKDSSSNSSSTGSSNSSRLSKRNWPNGFSRRRSGLSLSIDASMKVLREALYLEIARKKARQQLQRAQHNKAILNSIGKRDVSGQLTHTRTPALSERN